MYRTAMESLKQWKSRENKKPLLIRGARQVGKTWLMKEFGLKEYAETVYINFDGNRQMKKLFSPDFDVDRILIGLELYAGKRILPGETLLVFDEVQEVPDALASLKYFSENAPRHHILCAGSLLGVALHPETSFPVGKVEFLDLYPLSYTEFLRALGKERFADVLKKGDFALASTFAQTYTDLLKYYYFVGGMPEAVSHFSQTMDFSGTREIQQRILSAYEQDFSKHAPNDTVPRIRMLWNSIPSQLARENRKFMYGLIREGARAKEYEMAMLWLADCGLVHKVHRVSGASLPLKAYTDLRAFKLFFSDVGLLSCMAGLSQGTLVDGNVLFREFKGALTEQYVLQQLKAAEGMDVFYWSSEKGTAEVDFLFEAGGDIVPLEVKAEVNLQAKSLKAFREKYRPKISVRTSMAPWKKEDWLVNLPLYAVQYIREAIGG